MIGALFAQLSVSAFSARVKGWFELPGGEQFAWPRNKRPQRLLGTMESVAFAWLIFELEPDAAATTIGAWVVAKTVGNWKGWDLDSNDPGSSNDVHSGRRRLYAFLIANAMQVAWAIATAWFMGWVAVAEPTRRG